VMQEALIVNKSPPPGHVFSPSPRMAFRGFDGPHGMPSVGLDGMKRVEG
jgi:hypothetical protein